MKKRIIKAVPKTEPLPPNMEIGEMVSYYRNGWYVGRLVEVKGKLAGVRSIGNYLHKDSRTKWVGIDDLKAIDRGKDVEGNKN